MFVFTLAAAAATVADRVCVCVCACVNVWKQGEHILAYTDEATLIVHFFTTSLARDAREYQFFGASPKMGNIGF